MWHAIRLRWGVVSAACSIGVAAVCFSLGLPAPAAADSVAPQVELDRDLILIGKVQPVYVLIEFEVFDPPQTVLDDRPRVNLGMVLDRSGSMDDRGKMTYAKQAAKIVVDGLGAADRLAVVEYDDEITVLWPSSRVESPAMIKRRIDQLYPRGSTNLTGGMMKGVEEVLRAIDYDDINRVILLSDGLANQGITRPEKIKQLVREAKHKGVTISTIGLGLDYNEDLMQAIAEYGAGNYYFIENPNQMARIFNEELNTVFTTVAENALIKFNGTTAVGKIDVFGFPTEIDGHSATVTMENFYGGERRSLLLRLEVDSSQEGPLDLGHVEFTYLDRLDNAPKSMTFAVSVKAVDDERLVEESRNERVFVEANLIEADNLHAQYVRQFGEGDADGALDLVSALADKIDELNQLHPDVKLEKKLEALRMEAEEMDYAGQSADNRSYYLKSNQARYYKSQKGQRSKYLMLEGESGYDVERLQQALLDLKVYAGAVDGNFSTELTEAVKEFQRQNNLKVDGVAGPQTLKALKLY